MSAAARDPMSSSPVVILHTDRPDAALEAVRETHPDLVLHGCNSYEALPALIDATGAEVVYSVRFDGTPRFPRRALLESASVKWVSVGGSGTDHLVPWNADRITVTNAAGVAADMLAEYALGAMLSFSLDLRGFAARQRERRWTAAKVEPIAGRTVLVLERDDHLGGATGSRRIFPGAVSYTHLTLPTKRIV